MEYIVQIYRCFCVCAHVWELVCVFCRRQNAVIGVCDIHLHSRCVTFTYSKDRGWTGTVRQKCVYVCCCKRTRDTMRKREKGKSVQAALDLLCLKPNHATDPVLNWSPASSAHANHYELPYSLLRGKLSFA